ncbi:hypothetical protein [Massilia sp. LjRoot122]|uniref:hypothetical protein n=1 Tax=Massilia sp. LjRoot122 TaxID=3342257 RepID=UPI003ECFDEAF
MTHPVTPKSQHTVTANDGKVHAIRLSAPADWSGNWPTDRTGDILVTEYPGTQDGSVFIYWLGDLTFESPKVMEWIQTHVTDHDVVGVHVVFGFPAHAHSSLKGDLASLKVRAAARKYGSLLADVPVACDAKREAIAMADAFLNNVLLPTYTELVEALRWRPISTAPKDRYILGRDPGMKRPFVMIWNVREQAFIASPGLDDEEPTEWMDLPEV